MCLSSERLSRVEVFFFFFFFWLFLTDVVFSESLSDVYAKECPGTADRMTVIGGSTTERYERYRSMYENCTYVKGNLEIVSLELTDGRYDLSFLENVREVGGYVLIFSNFLTKIRLTRLRVIRGQALYDRGYSLYVELNSQRNNSSVGLQELQLPSLVEILKGKVLFKGNSRLCFGEKTIDWNHILLNKKQKPVVFLNISGHEKIDCQSHVNCHDNCTAVDGRRYCWGPGPDMCQKIHKGCRDCPLRRCSEDGICCDEQCVAGCSGHKQACLSCRNFVRDLSECVESCSSGIRRLTEWSIWTTEIPEDRYAQGSKCVNQCSAGFVLQDEFCAETCKDGFMVNMSVCVPCPGECPTTCKGTEGTYCWLHKALLPSYSKCLKVVGNLEIFNETFTGFAGHTEKISVADLEKLSGIEEITGALTVQAWNREFTSLNFLRNLRTIGGVGPEDTALEISGTSLKSLELKSLQKVEKKVYIRENADLCYAGKINWTTIAAGEITARANKNPSFCDAEGFVCSAMCLPSNGCLGPDDDSCITCRHFRLMNGRCSDNCSTENGFYVDEQGIRGNRQCRPCDEQCNGNCTGDGPEHCFKCKSSSHNGVCVAKCPSQTYEDANGICQQCNSVCNECTGNSSVLGQSGCNSCTSKTIRYEYETHGHCISSEDECNETYYFRHENVQTFNNNNSKTLMRICRRCHPECVACDGPKPFECRRCRNYRQRKSDDKDECVSECSESFRDVGRVENSTERLCVVREAAAWSSMNSLVTASTFFVSFLLILILVFAVLWRRRRKRLGLRCKDILAIDESDLPAIRSSQAKPNMASLRLIKESELRRGNSIGSGAFGTVYKGIWIPEKENVKIPVAIKVLQDNSSNTNQNVELLDEARIMASVCHPNCVRILAVCMTAQMMLVTQLMPLGCLLDYIRKEKSNVGSRVLLLWSVQIARGMQYLEESGVIHRDLAARNVLVHNPNQVKITDFGLAKLLDYEEEEIHSESGKMPIKWMALECIQNRVYSHKSDVWSYGVTLWEMFTYGSRPYENLQARQIPHALEKGERLPQPSICTLDVYMTLIKCWMLDAESRPTFSDLVDEFSRMAADPGRFLVIPGDTLMRLPSQAPDARDLFRMMSLPVDEPNLTIMSGEEYLRPAGLDLEDSDGFFSPTSSTCGRLMSIPEDVCYENSDATTGRRRAQSSECDAVDGQSHAKLVQQFSRERSQRYISDPCRKDDVEGGGKEDDDKLGHNSQLFRVDKDGYLPPHSVTTQPSYLELVYQPTTNQNSEPLTQTPPPPPPPPPQQYLDMNSSVGVSKDNLEYFDNEATGLSNGTATNDKPGAKLNSGETKRKEEPDYCNEAFPFTDLQHHPYRGLPHTDL